MARIEWHDGLELGIREIDEQHKHLIELANSLLHASHHAALREVAAAFHELREYTVYHFNDEEAYMRSVRYPKLEQHKAQHSELKREVKYFQDVIYRHGEITEAEIIHFLTGWLIDHIIRSDLDIKKWTEAKADSK